MLYAMTMLLVLIADRPPCDAQSHVIAQKNSEVNQLLKLADDPRTYWYDKQSLPGVYFDHAELFPVGYNVAAYDSETGKKIDPTGSANNDSKWMHTGGLAGCGPRVSVKRMLWIPKGSWIELYWNEQASDQTRNIPVRHVMGEYPEKTVAAEFMFDGVRLFEVRTRVRHKRGWQADQTEFGPKPAGYSHVDNCVECHEDVGKHSFAIDPTRDWYGVVRGLEKDGPIHWHPFKKASNAGVKPELRDDVKAFVRWRK